MFQDVPEVHVRRRQSFATPRSACFWQAAGGVRLKDGNIATSCPMAGASILPQLALFFLYASRLAQLLTDALVSIERAFIVALATPGLPAVRRAPRQALTRVGVETTGPLLSTALRSPTVLHPRRVTVVPVGLALAVIGAQGRPPAVAITRNALATHLSTPCLLLADIALQAALRSSDACPLRATERALAELRATVGLRAICVAADCADSLARGAMPLLATALRLLAVCVLGSYAFASTKTTVSFVPAIGGAPAVRVAGDHALTPTSGALSLFPTASGTSTIAIGRCAALAALQRAQPVFLAVNARSAVGFLRRETPAHLEAAPTT